MEIKNLSNSDLFHVLMNNEEEYKKRTQAVKEEKDFLNKHEFTEIPSYNIRCILCEEREIKNIQSIIKQCKDELNKRYDEGTLIDEEEEENETR